MTVGFLLFSVCVLYMSRMTWWRYFGFDTSVTHSSQQEGRWTNATPIGSRERKNWAGELCLLRWGDTCEYILYSWRYAVHFCLLLPMSCLFACRQDCAASDAWQAGSSLRPSRRPLRCGGAFLHQTSDNKALEDTPRSSYTVTQHSSSVSPSGPLRTLRERLHFNSSNPVVSSDVCHSIRARHPHRFYTNGSQRKSECLQSIGYTYEGINHVAGEQREANTINSFCWCQHILCLRRLS